MPDPYTVLGVAQGASLDQVRAAYRRACKTRHPDMGGSHEAMVELNAAYAFVLGELKRRRQSERDDTARTSPREEAHRGTDRPDTDRDIDEELENLRRASEDYEERIRAKRQEAWNAGERVQWAKLGWDDLFAYLVRTARSGLKGVALLVAALMGIGSLLVELNIVSLLIVAGSLLGLAISVALKNDKGGLMSASLLLFGLMTVVLPPVRAAVFAAPLATIGVLICLALIFKFVSQGGRAGAMTGGLLAAYVLAVIVGGVIQQPARQANAPVEKTARPLPSPVASSVAPPSSPDVAPQPRQPVAPPEERTLVASDGATLKFVEGVTYRLKVRTGRPTTLRATSGLVRLERGDTSTASCVDMLEFAAEPSDGPWRFIDGAIRACEAQATMVGMVGNR